MAPSEACEGNFLFAPVVARSGQVHRFVMLRSITRSSATIDCFERFRLGQALSLKLNDGHSVDGHVVECRNFSADVAFTKVSNTLNCLPYLTQNPKIEIDCGASILSNGSQVKVRVASISQRELRVIGCQGMSSSQILLKLPGLVPIEGRVMRAVGNVGSVKLRRPLPYSSASNWAVDMQRRHLSAEHRDGIRVSCEQYVSANGESGSSTIQLRDISRNGLRFSASPDQFDLGATIRVVACDTILPSGEIIWKSGSFYGLYFSKTLTEAAFLVFAVRNLQPNL